MILQLNYFKEINNSFCVRRPSITKLIQSFVARRAWTEGQYAHHFGESWSRLKRARTPRSEQSLNCTVLELVSWGLHGEVEGILCPEPSWRLHERVYARIQICLIVAARTYTFCLLRRGQGVINGCTVLVCFPVSPASTPEARIGGGGSSRATRTPERLELLLIAFDFLHC